MVTEKSAARQENPLMPDERLRQMYTAMVQMRMLEEKLSKRKGGKDRETVRGEEAARVSTALSLEKGDMISDFADAAGMDLLLGVGLAALMGKADAKKTKAAVKEEYPFRVGVEDDMEKQLQRSLGAAEALKVQGAGRVLLVYVAAGGGRKLWKRALNVAGKKELPVIYVVLPAGDGDAGELSRRSQSWGVPGFPVDGSDAIALYRVVQESLVRARAGGGAALIECVRFAVSDKDEVTAEDPIERLGGLLVTKGVANAAWMERTRTVFGRRLRGGR